MQDFKEYKTNKGMKSWREMSVDFFIVAQATIEKLDIVVSEDNRTMLSDAALKTYLKVNKQHNFITPNFIGYDLLPYEPPTKVGGFLKQSIPEAFRIISSA